MSNFTKKEKKPAWFVNDKKQYLVRSMRIRLTSETVAKPVFKLIGSVAQLVFTLVATVFNLWEYA